MAINHPAFANIRLKNLFDNMPSMADNQGFQDEPDAQSSDYQSSAQPFSQGFQDEPSMEDSPYESSIGAGSQFAPTTPPANRTEPSINWMEQMEKFRPETEATERFKQLMDRFPQYERPSLARAIVASGMAAGDNGLENSQKFLHAPYVRDIAAWKEQAGPAYNAANLERQANVNERQLFSSTINAQIAQQKADEAERYNKERVEVTRINALANQARAAQWKVEVRGNSVVAWDPNNPQTPLRTLGTIPGAMSEAEKIMLEGQWDREIAIQQGQNQQNNPNAPIFGDGKGGYYTREGKELVPMTIRGQTPTTPTTTTPGQTTPGQTQNGPNLNRVGTPGQAAGGAFNRLTDDYQKQEVRRTAYQVSPDARSIMSKVNGRYEFKERPKLTEDTWWWPGDSSVKQEAIDRYDRIRGEIEPDYVPPVSMPSLTPSHTTTNPAPNSQNPAAGRGGAGTSRSAPEFGSPTARQQRAAELLKQNGQPVTDANIDAVIKRGMVQ